MTEAAASPFGASASAAFGIEDLAVMTPAERFRAYVARVGDEVAMTRLLDDIVAGQSLSSWAKNDGFSYTAVRKWVMADPVRRADYEAAQSDRAHFQAESIVEVSQKDCTEPVFDGEGREVGRKVSAAKVQQAKLEVDSLKWIAGRMNNRYADKVTVDANVSLNTATDDDLIRRMEALAGPGLAAVARQVLSGGQQEAGGA